MEDPLDHKERFRIVLCIINITLTIFSFVFTYLDKVEIDACVIVDLIFGFLLIASLISNLFRHSFSHECIFFGINGLLWMANNILSIFTNLNRKYDDFLSICIFCRLMRALFVLLFFITIP